MGHFPSWRTVSRQLPVLSCRLKIGVNPRNPCRMKTWIPDQVGNDMIGIGVHLRLHCLCGLRAPDQVGGRLFVVENQLAVVAS